jgi:DNA-binding response OmpR family regulator
MNDTNDRQATVLLIEDSPVDATMIRGQLTRGNGNAYEVVVESTLKNGLERLEVGDVDVILLDLTLPDTQGLETFLKAYRIAPQVPIVIITSLDDRDVAYNAVRSGAQDYLIKGKLDTESLIHAVNFAIERHTHQQRLNPYMTGLWAAASRADIPGGALVGPTDGIFSPLREREADTFVPLCDRYGKLIQLAYKQRQSKQVEPISEELHGLAMYLCMVSAGPGDVEEIHRNSLERLSADSSTEELQSFVEEGQMLLIELFRYLIDAYRDSLLRNPSSGPAS